MRKYLSLGWSGLNCKKLKSKNQFVNDAKILGPIRIYAGDWSQNLKTLFNDQSHLNWENGAVSLKTIYLPHLTKPGERNAPASCPRCSSCINNGRSPHYMEGPWTKEGVRQKKPERTRTGKPVEREDKKTTQGDTQRQGTNEQKRETKGETVILRLQ